MRGIYCALVVADILGLLPDERITKGLGDFIASCQTYEGGIASIPFGEAHAGYNYCGLASLILLGETDKIDLESMAEWVAQRQLRVEGGFNGRINKLVDSCYNFWVGASAALLSSVADAKVDGNLIIKQEALQAYGILACQHAKSGGLMDKPKKYPDIYHTMYALSGLSLCQCSYGEGEGCFLGGVIENKLECVNPVFNARNDKVEKAKKYYSK